MLSAPSFSLATFAFVNDPHDTVARGFLGVTHFDLYLNALLCEKNLNRFPGKDAARTRCVDIDLSSINTSEEAADGERASAAAWVLSIQPMLRKGCRRLSR